MTEVTYEQVANEMPVLDAFILEVLRMYPGSILLSRRIANEDMEIGGMFVPKGKLVHCDIHAASRDERKFSRPNEFVFDRYMDRENAPSVLAFGVPGSAHYCAGTAIAKMNIKTFVATLLRQYTVELDRNQSQDFKHIPLTSPKSGVVVSGMRQR